MPELRKDPIIGRWVIIASERAKRPLDFGSEPRKASEGFCPFCPGNEDKTPEEVLAYRPADTSDNTAGWWVRVVPNKFPALVREGGLDRAGDGMYDRMNGIGAHEVIIESPSHNQTLTDYSLRQVQEILWCYRDRIMELKKDPNLRYIMIFKNYGWEAGASLDHPHSQVIALPIIPKRVKEEIDGAQDYFKFRERCVFCDMVRQEMADQKRVVLENEDFLAFCPYASRFPFETWILPKKHTTHYMDIQKKELENFAAVLQGSLARIKTILGDPPFNYMLHTSPCNEPASQFPFYHWHLEITPKLTRIAGFEWGTGFYINPMPPEMAAQYLRENMQKAK